MKLLSRSEIPTLAIGFIIKVKVKVIEIHEILVKFYDIAEGLIAPIEEPPSLL